MSIAKTNAIAALIFALTPLMGIASSCENITGLEDTEIDRRITLLKEKDKQTWDVRNARDGGPLIGPIEHAYICEQGGFQNDPRIDTQQFYKNEINKTAFYIQTELRRHMAMKISRKILADPKSQSELSRLALLATELGVHIHLDDEVVRKMVRAVVSYTMAPSMSLEQLVALMEFHLWQTAENQVVKETEGLDDYLFSLSQGSKREAQPSLLAAVEKIQPMRLRMRELKKETKSSDRFFGALQLLDHQDHPHCCKAGCRNCPISFGIRRSAKSQGLALPKAGPRRITTPPPENLKLYQILGDLERDLPELRWR